MSDMIRLTGIASGLDVDSLVKSMMRVENLKMDKLKQNRQLLQWKQDLYRDLLGDMTSFKNTYFNVLKSDSYMLSSNNYSGFDVSNVNSSSSTVVTATASSGAISGTYNIKDITTALKASYSGTIAKVRESENLVDFPVNATDITDSKYDKLTIKVNDADYTINLGGNYANLSALVGDINSKLVKSDMGGTETDISKMVRAFLSPDGTSIQFNATTGNTLNSISDSSDVQILDNKMDFNINIVAGLNDRLSINVNGTTTNITLASGEYNDLSGLVSEINNQLTSSNINDKLQAALSLDGTKIQFVNQTSSDQISVQGNASRLLGFPSSGFDLYPNIGSRMSSLFNSDLAAKVSFTVNGKNFNYDFSSTGLDKDKSVVQIMNDISSTAGVKISYSELGRKFTIESLTTGQAQGISATEASDGSGGDFLQTLFGTRTISTQGRDATATITNPNGNSLTLTRTDNVISIDGITFNLFKDDVSADGINISVTANTQKTYDKIKTFIDKYNEMIDKIQTKVYEKKQYSYKPLTDEQKKDMSESDITAWEAKTKEGLLKNDSSLQNMMYSMRRAFFDKVEGVGLSLSQIGLSTSSDYSLGGKIIINEDKLKNAIQNNGSQITDLFAKSSNISYDPDHKSDTGRYNEIGIFQRINDIFKDYTRTTRNSNLQKGLLIEKAGIKGDISEFESIISKQLKKDYDDKIYDLTIKLAAKENKYYLQFSKLEVAMQKMNEQSSWLTQQLSSFSGS